MNSFKGYWGVGLGAMLVCTACGSAVDDRQGGDAVAPEQALEPIIEVAGRKFMRRDQWSQADFERISFEGRADQDGSTPEVLAAQLRGHMAIGNEYYIELEPNLELAKKILSGQPVAGTPDSEAREGRTIIGTDDRSLWSGSTSSVPATTIGFNESRGSGVRINDTTLYTAAHVVYDTQVGNNWFCANGTTTAGCNRPRWRFGVNGTSAFAGWTAYNCDAITIPTAFVNLVDTSNESNWAHWDFAVVNLINCTGRGGTSWLGTLPLTDQGLLDASANRLGYPARALCPTGANGDTGFASGSSVLGTDCPGTGSFPGSTYRLNNTAAPYAGAQLWYASSTDVWAGDATSIRSTVDLTHGDSGSPLYVFAPGSSTDRRVIGVSSLAPQTYNVFNRWTSETYNWFHTYASFP